MARKCRVRRPGCTAGPGPGLALAKPESAFAQAHAIGGINVSDAILRQVEAHHDAPTNIFRRADADDDDLNLGLRLHRAPGKTSRADSE